MHMQSDHAAKKERQATMARVAAARGDAATAVRLSFAASMYSFTRGDDVAKYKLTAAEEKEAKSIRSQRMDQCEFNVICERVNAEDEGREQRGAHPDH